MEGGERYEGGGGAERGAEGLFFVFEGGGGGAEACCFGRPSLEFLFEGFISFGLWRIKSIKLPSSFHSVLTYLHSKIHIRLPSRLPLNLLALMQILAQLLRRRFGDFDVAADVEGAVGAVGAGEVGDDGLGLLVGGELFVWSGGRGGGGGGGFFGFGHFRLEACARCKCSSGAWQ